jgi:N-acetyl-anhydromuramyl-L-alanine amidase AmpD
MQNTLPVIVEYFRRPGTKVGAHYLVDSVAGTTIQMADERMVVFHDACFNDESIGIEHEGYVEAGALWYSDELYRASARLVRDIARRHDIPLDRSHILGHGEAPDCSDHTDPGPGWDWERFMAEVERGE